MKTILIIIVSNPLKSHKSTEAFRLASSLSSYRHTTSILIYKTAYALVSEPIYNLINSHLAEQYISILKKNNVPLYYIKDQKDESPPIKVLDSFYNLALSPLNWQQLCQLIENSDNIFLF